ncbi:MAG: hypothetical protein QOD77_2029 [Thermoplasmata archaeon]|jgi:hypothetical protein|nr:hypothetical protein [Thermoplasmata archaeon]
MLGHNPFLEDPVPAAMARAQPEQHVIPFNEQLLKPAATPAPSKAEAGLVRPLAAKPRARPATVPKPRPPRAVFVVHGMGQQVPFETLDLVYQGLQHEETARGDGPPALLTPKPVEEVIAGTKVRRLEVTLAAGTPQERQVHLYEGYWAPLTEGRVTLRDVVAFLASGAGNGLRNAFGRRQKWRFDKFRQPWVFGLPLVQLLVTSLALASLLGLAAASTATFAAAVTGTGMPLGIVSDLTWLAAFILAPAIAMAVLMGASSAGKRLGWRKRLARRVRVAEDNRRPMPRVPALALVLDALGMLALLATVLAAAAVPFLAAWAALSWAKGASWLPMLDIRASFVVWGLLVLLVAVARRVLVQTLGDVAAFVNTHKLDRFNELRDEIKRTVRKVAMAVYDAKDAQGGPRYDAVCIMGHSLGSVVAYSTLNDLVNEDDDVEGQSRGVLARTPLLLTFGSPLAKTSFIYGLQRSKTSATREALAGLVQPLIQKYDYRTMEWINLHARADIISGRLRPEYDDEEAALDHEKEGKVAKRVQDLRDPHATTPLLAHNEYWRNPLLWRELRSRLV